MKNNKSLVKPREAKLHRRSRSQWIVSVLLALCALILLVMGLVGFLSRRGNTVVSQMEQMRSQAVLGKAAGVYIDQGALQIRREARAFADENKYSRNQRVAYVDEQEAIYRQQASERFLNFSQEQRQAILPGIAQVEALLQDHGALYLQERAAYADAWHEQQASATPPPQEEGLADAEASGETMDEAMVLEEEVDYRGFVPSEELAAREAAIRPAYATLFAMVRQALPDLPEDAEDELYKPLTQIIFTPDAGFEASYDRYQENSGEKVLQGSNRLRMTLARNGSNWIYLAIGLLILALTVFYYKPWVARLGIPRLIISVFFLLLLVAAALYNIRVNSMISIVLWRTGMYGVLTLAMLPGIQSGISLNMGMPIGIISGLVSTLIALEMNMTGWGAFLFAVAGGILLSIPVGWLYGLLLNRLKGNEMTVSTYVGFSYVSLMSIAWMLLPFYNSKLTWALGKGLRQMHNMSGSFGGILDNLLSFSIFGIRVPTGLLLFFLLACLVMWLFARSKQGTAMIAAGSNARFAEASGIKVDRMRLLGTTISTVIAAVGIIVYSQSFGFMALYAGPRQMGFVAASAILIGGASTSRAKVFHVILGTFLFQGVLVLGVQVANAAITTGGLSEVMRILISNGIILYALTQSGGASRD